MVLIIIVVNNAVVDIFKHKSLPTELIGYNVAYVGFASFIPQTTFNPFICIYLVCY